MRRPNKILFGVFASVLAAVLMLSAGCGGGTTGTGGTGSDEFRGRILSLSGSPINQATVTVAETGDSSVSDAEGNFNLETELVGVQATLLVEKNSSSGKAVVSDLPDEPVVVDLSLVLDERKQSLSVKEKKVTRKRHRPEKTPIPATPTVAPPVETPVPAETQTATPTPAEPQPTIEPTPTAPEPTPLPQLARFRGVVLTSDPTLLDGARIGLLGSSKQVRVRNNGEFLFRDYPTTGARLSLSTGDNNPVVLLEGLDSKTKRVVLTLRLDNDGSGGVRFSVEAIQVFERE